MATLCGGCQHDLLNIESLACYLCKDKYDLQCANISTMAFISMTPEQKQKWKCQTCRSKEPKTGNLNTPIRQLEHKLNKPSNPPEEQTNTPESNITIRKKLKNSSFNVTLSDSSFLGDTICSEDRENYISPNPSLQNLSELIMQRLKENNKYIISEIKNTIEDEIKKAIFKLKEELEGRTNILTKQNEERILEIKNINEKIEVLSKQNETLKAEIKELQTLKTTSEPKLTEENSKKIVIYGFSEHHNESEWELHSRLIDMFHDILNVDLTGYIEEIYRMGRKNTKTRPLVIELLSKRMSKYIIENGNYFQGTGIFITEFLNENARKHRNLLREEMLKARKNGQYAIIRNNKLFIEGKQVTLTDDKETFLTSTLTNQYEKENKQTTNINYKFNNNEAPSNYTFRNYRTTI
ncbi:unnamed protein product [Chrysodeixis includens]|uniref:Uncharacterized protein n=1 Tax=Chrysodeixis includens TaxID=689277 RepID=A0A9P0FWV2_CHRIL|nr:unnamed protein product [Chrysodeixis includens]